MITPRAVLFLAGFLLIPAPSRAESGPFAQGRVRASLGAGSSGAFGDRYVVFSVGAGYFLLDGLEVGLDADFWVGADPFIASLSPEMRYIFIPVSYTHLTLPTNSRV